MDNVERMYHHLVRTIRSRFPQYLVQPFDVGELHQTILPYRHHRRELGLETNEDYEITLLELLSGVRGYLIVDERMRDVLTRELASRNPDPSAFRQFVESQVALSPEAMASLDSGSVTTSWPTHVITPLPTKLSPVATASIPAAPLLESRVTPAVAFSRPSLVPRDGDHCRSCDEALPSGRNVTFCPFCGENLTTINCSACGTELELGWRYCPVCGKPAANR